MSDPLHFKFWFSFTYKWFCIDKENWCKISCCSFYSISLKSLWCTKVKYGNDWTASNNCGNARCCPFRSLHCCAFPCEWSSISPDQPGQRGLHPGTDSKQVNLVLTQNKFFNALRLTTNGNGYAVFHVLCPLFAEQTGILGRRPASRETGSHQPLSSQFGCRWSGAIRKGFLVTADHRKRSISCKLTHLMHLMNEWRNESIGCGAAWIHDKKHKRWIQYNKGFHSALMCFLNTKVGGWCGRCQMICVDQDTGAKSKAPLLALSACRSGKVGPNRPYLIIQPRAQCGVHLQTMAFA